VESAVVRKMRAWAGFIQKAGPYLLLEIVMPGGTLLALLLFIYQRRQLTDGADVPALVSAIGALRTAYQRFAPEWLKARVQSLFRSCKDAPRTRNRTSPACRTSD
jgi:hypothetical protein